LFIPLSRICRSADFQKLGESGCIVSSKTCQCDNLGDACLSVGLELIPRQILCPVLCYFGHIWQVSQDERGLLSRRFDRFE
jgi:hypothetical protein